MYELGIIYYPDECPFNSTLVHKVFVTNSSESDSI